MQSKHRLHKWHVLFNYFFVFVNLVSLRVHSFMTSTKCKTGQLPPPYHPQPSNFGLTPPFPRHAYLVSVPPPPCGGIMFWNFLKKKMTMRCNRKIPSDRCFHVNFAKFLRTTFLQNASSSFFRKYIMKTPKQLMKSARS